MQAEIAETLAQVLRGSPVATLATLHRGEPATSMVPFALLPGTGDVIIHISRLATHTQDLQAHASASLLVMAPPGTSDTPLALPRVSLQGEAHVCAVADADYGPARAAYLARLPEAEELFSFGDFSLWLLRPRHLRLVAGFGRAHTIMGDDYRQWIAGQTG